MAQSVGFNIALLMGFEDSFLGGQAIKKTILLPWLDEIGIESTIEEKKPETLMFGRNRLVPIRNHFDVKGPITVPIDMSACLYWLKASLGEPVKTSVNGLNKYVFKVRDDLPSFFLDKGFPDLSKYELIRGCKVGALTMEFGGKSDFLTAIVDVIGSSSSYLNAPYDSNPIVPTVRMFNSMMFNVFENDVLLKGVESGKIIIDNDLIGDDQVYDISSNQNVMCIIDGKTSITGEMTLLFDGVSSLEKAINNTSTKLDIVFDYNEEEYIKFTMPEVSYKYTSPIAEDIYGIYVRLLWTAFCDMQDDSSIIVEISTRENIL